MGMRFVHSVLKGVPPARLADLIAQASTVLPGPRSIQTKWGDLTEILDTRLVSAVAEGDTITLSPEAWRLASEVARLTGTPHLELRVNEGDHWDFTLNYRGEVVADFSTNVGYWNDDPAAPRPWKKGNAKNFAEVWGVPLERVEPYLIDWGSLKEPRWVVQGDKYSTGQWSQVSDFMRAAGVPDFKRGVPPLQFTIPCWKMIEHRQPWWRRAIRRASLWMRGVYPDVPRRTAAEKELWRKRLANTRIVAVDTDKLFENR